MSLEEENVQGSLLEEGAPEMDLQVKRPRPALPAASLSIFSHQPHKNNSIIIRAMITSTLQMRKLRSGQEKSFTQGFTTRKERS